MLLNPAEGCVCVCCLRVSSSLCVRMLMSRVPLLCQQAPGPVVNMIEFMHQQTCHSTLSGVLVIEVIYYLDTCRKMSEVSHRCSDYFAGGHYM